MSKNFQAFLKLDASHLSNQYIVLIDKKMVAKGKDIVALLKRVRKQFPTKIPFIAKILDKSLHVL